MDVDVLQSDLCSRSDDSHRPHDPAAHRLLRAIAALPSENSATDWAQRALVAKNQLTAADARLLEVAFELRLSALLPSEPFRVVRQQWVSGSIFVCRR
jgi:hypothetical protein